MLPSDPHGPEFLLITTCEAGRWMIPKGWLSDGLTLREVAEREALEEAGVVGKSKKRPVGEFNYTNHQRTESARLCQRFPVAGPTSTKSLPGDEATLARMAVTKRRRRPGGRH
jgi:8-oxo-dGTP pyrophosphatase MutT (NUDIX family)